MRLIRQINEVRGHYGVVRTIQLALREIWRIVVHQWLLKSYSQHFEDLLATRLLDGSRTGLYVDIGCHDPVRLSNTYRLYRRGWSGVCIDASPEHAERFAKVRPRDTFVNVGVGMDSIGPQPFYVHAASALSTFSAEQSKRYAAEGHPLVKTIQMPVLSLGDIFLKYVGDRGIDFLSLDIEGLDFVALQSNDWDRYRPTLICFELEATGDSAASRAVNPEVDAFLRAQDYQAAGIRGVNAFYRTVR